MTHHDANPPAFNPEVPQRRAARADASVWVGASAGTGKTKVLTDRVLTLLLAGTPPEKILCLTFTKAAAAEMSNRLADKLAVWSTLPDADLFRTLDKLLGTAPTEAQVALARRLFARVLDVPGGMKIQTIHSFCQALLRRFPLEAGIAPHFEVMDDRDAAEAMAEARDDVLSRARSGTDPELADALSTITALVHEVKFPELLVALSSQRGRIRRMLDAHGGLDGAVAAICGLLEVPVGARPSTLLEAACADAALDTDGLRLCCTAFAGGSAKDVEKGDALAAFLNATEGPARLALFDAYKAAFLTSKDEPRKTLATKKVLTAQPLAEDLLLKEAERLCALCAQMKSATVAAATTALLRIADAVLGRYEGWKRARARMDYDDLIQTARRLLETEGQAAWVLFKLDAGLDHLLIDEAQDTNPDQWAVVRGITREFFAGAGARDETTRTVFAVGDRKQSIYSFQGADPDAFEAMRGLFADHVPASGATWDEVPLEFSFRSTPAVLEAVDAVFSTTGSAAQDGVVLPGENVRHIPFRRGQAGLVEVWPPVVPAAAEEPDPWKPPVERLRADSAQTRLARLVAKRIHRMVTDKERLESANRPIRPGDIMVLVRRRGPFVEDLVRALKELDVEVAGVDRMVLTEQMAVMDLMALGQFLLLPEDDLTLACVLKSPLIGLTEDDLFDLAHNRGRLSLWDALAKRQGRADAFGEAHAVLSDLLGRADFLRPHELYAHVLSGPLQGRRRLLSRLGWEAEDPIDEFLSMTLAYERGHAPSLQGFLHWFETGATEIKRDLESGDRDAVRVMTVHGSKGLQAPVVFLPDTMQMPTVGPTLLWHGDGEDRLMLWPPGADHTDAVCQELKDAAKAAREREYRRLLYVAMTRAEDRLIVCGWETRKSRPDGCWYDLIRAALEPLAATAEDPFLEAEGETEGAEVLRLTSDQKADPDRAREAREEIDHHREPPAWLRRAPEAEPRPPRPLTPSAPTVEDPPVRSPVGQDATAERVRFQRGRLIHRLLQSLPDIPDGAARAEAARRYLARPAWQLPPGEQEQIAAETLAVIAEPAFAALFGPGSRAEVPVVGLVGRHVVSGQVDRLVVTEDEVLVVDYKTNRPPPQKVDDVSEGYLRQMAAYRGALADLYPGRPVRCALLWTDGPRLMELPAGRLDDLIEDMAR
ncbi:double-strand break repair helicase AddA [Caenispirillum salinarum]|uniref:double-strand break repair helicase AddA n=1 Tax=Caenispirillum salinarum TaxID=859058 RepID=UPI003850E80B